MELRRVLHENAGLLDVRRPALSAANRTKESKNTRTHAAPRAAPLP